MQMLPIFPRSGFDQSVTTPVLLGVLASWGFTETLGWVFAGLVVPGYLAAVFLLEPAAGGIDLVEAVITYAAARAIGEHLPRFGVTSRVFGRERFFLVVLVSILVRLAVEGFLLPRVVPHATWAYSIGLVLVPLAANACWKTGLARGLVQNGVPTLIVYALLRWILVPYTNLSLAGFELATENLAAGFLASPKAYILLVTGAMIAAAANVRYGWDFNGILVPALLGLAVVEPIKFAATFAETLVLCVAVAILLRVTPLKRANIEGPRRTVLFFSVDYALRFGWAAAMGKSLPGGDIVAFMGFGYLLPSLLAVKISQKSSAPLVLLPTLKVSVLGFMVGSLIGFAAHMLDRTAQASDAPLSTRLMSRPPSSPAAATLWVSQLAIEGIAEPDSNVTGDLGRIRSTLEAVARGEAAPGRAVALEVSTIDDGVVVVREHFDSLAARRGLPAYAFRVPLPERPVVALVPAPLACPAAAAMAGYLLAGRDVDAVVVAGIEEPSKAWIEVETTAHAAARWLAARGTLLTVRDRADPRLGTGARASPSGPADNVERAARRVAGTTLVSDRDGFVLAIDPVAVAVALAPARSPIALESATDMVSAVEAIRPATHPGESEHLVGLRRLVLEPLLAPSPSEASRALAPFAASALGYRVTGPSRWAGGGEGIALLPAQRGMPIALFVRTSGVQHRFVECPAGSHHEIRDLAVRLGVAVDADAIVLGEAFDGAMRAGAVRAAHGAAMGSGAPVVLLVREDKSRDGAVFSTWMDDGTAMSMASRALASLGIAAVEAPADTAMRDLATRTLPRPTAIVAVSAGGKALEAASLDGARRAHEHFPDLQVRDGTVRDVAVSLAAAVDAARPATRNDIDETVRRAVSDGSVLGARRLSAELATSSLRAALVRAREGTFVVAVARTDRRRLVVVSALSDTGDWRIERRATFAACMEAPLVPGVCEALDR